MEKNLKLIKKNDNYCICDESINIEIISLKIDSKKIYDEIYSKLPDDDNSVKINIETSLAEEKDKIIFKQIKCLFEKIDESINEQLNSK